MTHEVRRFRIEPRENLHQVDLGWSLTLSIPSDQLQGATMNQIGGLIQHRLFMCGIALDQCQIREVPK